MTKNVYWGVHSALGVQATASVLMVGDSWFWYPVDNLATELGGMLQNETFVAIGRTGAEAADWSQSERKAIDFGFRMFAGSAKVLMLSGGGNDVVGQDDFLRLIKPDCSQATTVAECYGPTQPRAIVTGIINAYREVIVRFRAFNPQAPVLMHNYDNAWPTGRGLFGPADWLKVPMDIAKVPLPLRRDLFKDLLSALHDGQVQLAKEPGLGTLVPVQTAGELPETGVARWWANELHPTPRGFARIARNRLLEPLGTALA